MRETTNKRTVEILAPAGSYECFRAALSAGADAVYAGGTRFGARAWADNFSGEEMIRAIEEAHLLGKKLYLTVNTLLKESEIGELTGYLMPFYEKGLDAVIVQDMGVLRHIKRYFPGLDIHASTQMTITDDRGAYFLEQAGAARVVPARELSLEEIRKIRSHTKMEIECFVHGALCYCYSGQCLLSSMIGGRSGNRGQCAQPCRLLWSADGRARHYMSMKDMCALELIPDLVEAGIDSFKIEGRMKKPEYVAVVTSVYRRYTDLYLEKGRKGFHVAPEDREMLMDLYNRGGSHTGYYKQYNGVSMLSLDRPNHTGVPAVKVLQCRGRRVDGTALTQINPGDVIETGKGKQNNYTAGSSVKKGGKISFLLPKGASVKKGTVFPRIRNEQLIQSLRRDFLTKTLQTEVRGRLKLICGRKAVLEVCRLDYSFSVQSEENVQKAQSRPLEEEQVRKRLSRTGETDFYFHPLEIHMEENVFLPVQELNRMRRQALEGLRQRIVSAFERDTAEMKSPEKPDDCVNREFSSSVKIKQKDPAISVLAETQEQLIQTVRYIQNHPSSRICRVYVDSSLAGFLFDKKNKVQNMAGLAEKIRGAGREIFLTAPRIFRRREASEFEGKKQDFITFPFDGLLVRNCGEFRFLQECGFDKKIILDHNLYVFNSEAKRFWNEYGITHFTAPPELCADELTQLGLDSVELIAYGRLPVMVSAQCISSVSSGCRGENSIIFIEDRYKNRYPVKNNCESCCSVVYNTLPVCLYSQGKRLAKLAPESLRIQFSTESGDKVTEILSLFDRPYGEYGQEDIPFEYTQGHFKKGII